MPRLIDFTSATLTETNLMRAFDRLNTELSQATTMATSALLELPVWTGTHQGADLNTAIDRIDSKITNAAVLVGKAGVGLTSRVQDFTTGTHDVTRLHAELDRLHARIAALATRSPSETLPAYPITVHRTGGASYIGTAGTLTTDTAGNARHGLPYVIRRNLFDYHNAPSQAYWSKTDTAATFTANALPNPVTGEVDAYKWAIGANGLSHNVYRANYFTTAAGNTNADHVLSIYVKKGNYRYFGLGITRATGLVYSVFDFDTASFILLAQGTTAANHTVTALPDGWFRLAIRNQCDASTGNAQYALVASNGGSAWAATGTEYVYTYGAQLERTATLSALQGVTGGTVDGSVLNGAGLVLEPAATNKLTSNVATGTDTSANTTGFQTTASFHIATGATISTTILEFYQGSRSLRVVTPGTSASEGVDTSPSALSGMAANTTYAGSGRIKGTAGQQVRLVMRDYTNGVNSTIQTITLTGGWDFASVTLTTGATTPTDIRMSVAIVGTSATTYYIDALQVEIGSVATSWVDGTRNAELAGIVAPHNLLTYSDQFNNAAWTKSDGTNRITVTPNAVLAPDNTMTADQIDLAAGVNTGGTPDDVVQAITAASATRTFSVWMRAITGTVVVRLIFQGSGASSAITLDTNWQRVQYTVTAANPKPGFDFNNSTGTGSIAVWGAQLTEGSHPGVYVRTLDQAVANPGNGMDPAWVQNGYIEWYSVHPGDVGTLGSSGGWNFIGSGSPSSSSPGNLRVYRFPWATSTNYVKATRNTNVGAWNPDIPLGGFLGVLYLYDGARHRMRLEWTNYINAAGGREMWLRLYIDGVRVFNTERSAMDGSSSWLSVDPPTLLSDGYTNAVISLLTFGTPTLPSGAQAST